MASFLKSIQWCVSVSKPIWGQITFLTSQSQKNEIQSSPKLQPTTSLTADKDKLGQFPLVSHWTPPVTWRLVSAGIGGGLSASSDVWHFNNVQIFQLRLCEEQMCGGGGWQTPPVRGINRLPHGSNTTTPLITLSLITKRRFPIRSSMIKDV